MNRSAYTITLIHLMFSLLSCKENIRKEIVVDPQNHMVFDSVEYVTEFPKEFILRDKKETGLETPGLWDYQILDSVMILSTRLRTGAWKFYSLPDFNYLGSFLNLGEGPFELSSYPTVSDKAIVSEDGEIYSYLYNFNDGRLLKLNISKSIRQNEESISIVDELLPPYLFNFVVIDSITYFCKELGNRETQQLRYIHSDTTKSVTPVMDRLNEASIKVGEDYNILSTMTRYNNRNGVVVEMPLGLNYINLYSLDESFQKTICIGNELDNIQLIQDTDRMDRKAQFSDLRLFDGFFGIVSVDEPLKSYLSNRIKLSTILLFDWNGNPLAELKPQEQFTSFDIDFKRKELYVFDLNSDIFLKYDIKNVLDYLSQ